MTNLTDDQDSLLSAVQAAVGAYREAQRSAELRARQLAQLEIAELREAMDLKIRIAFEAGIPKRQIRMFGMGTSAPAPLDDSLNRTSLKQRTQ